MIAMIKIDRRAVLLGLAGGPFIQQAQGLALEAISLGPQNLSYVMSHLDNTVALLNFDVEAPGDGEIHSRGTIETAGLVDLLQGKRQSTLNVVSRLGEEGWPRPASFRAVYEKPDRKREIEITYDGAGEIVELQLFNDGSPRTSDVPEALWADTVDPLTGILQMQHWLTVMRGKAGGQELVVPVFDGRSRWDYKIRTKPDGVDLIIDGIVGFDQGDLIVTLPDDEEPRRLKIRLGKDRLATPSAVEGAQTVLERKA